MKLNRMLMTGVSLLVFAASLPGTAQAQWGDIEGQFVLEGEVPEPVYIFKKGDPVKDAEVCAAEDFKSDALVVDSETKGIANVFIYLRSAPQIHPDLAESKEDAVVFDQKGCRFIPHALFVRTDQDVIVKSDDPIAHNTHTFTLRNQPVNILIAANDREGVEVSVPLPEILPMQVKCDLHPHMLAYWLILDHPYAAISGKDGKFTIKGLPAGEHSFRVWHEKVGYVDRAYTVTVKDGETTKLEPVKIPLERFED